jgi:hypothetical protein
MKKFIYAVVFGLVVGGFCGFAGGIFLFPYLFPPPSLNETVDVDTQQKLLATGTFIHANPADPIHYGKGDVQIYPSLLHLADNFEVGPGPKYHVYLVPDKNITPASKVEQTMFIDLGRLKAFRGSQNYPIPDGVSLADFPTVVIWCEQFNVLISPATIASR